MAIAPQFERVRSFSHGLAAVKVEGKWGYVTNTGRMLVPPQFTQAQPFSEGLAAVKVRDRWGYINPLGQYVVTPQFEAAGSFRGGKASVLVGGTNRDARHGTWRSIRPPAARG
jgi:hypothetical protein